MKRHSLLPRTFPFAPRKLAVLVAVALSGSALAEVRPVAAPATAIERVGLPISFERNHGQFPAEVLFVSRGLQGLLALRAGEVAITPRRDGVIRGEPLRLRLGGANAAPEVEERRPLATRSHHYLGNAASDRIENVPHFGELQLKDVYPGIDMVLHGRDGTLEYDFVVAPRADPRDIRIELRGTDHAAIDAEGNLRIARGDERLLQHAPIAFQGEGAQRRPVGAGFQLVEGAEGPEARFVLGAYDPAIPLTIDPLISYSTYVGSSGGDGGTVVRVDSKGDLYFTQLGASGSVDPVVVTKLDPHSNTVVYQTSFGGHGSSTGSDLALGGAAGTTLYVTGTTRALDFPVLPPKSDHTADAFVAQLAPSGTLVNTVLIGGSGSDFGTAIGLDPAGNVYVGGITDSMDLGVTTGEPQLNVHGFPGRRDGFAAKLDASLATDYLRYIGGSGDDAVNSLAVDPAGRAILAGMTTTPDFPQVNAGAPTSPPPSGFFFQSRGFAAKLSSDGASFAYSQFVGGSSTSADAVAFDPTTGDAIFAGTTSRNDLVPTPARPFAGGLDAFVVRIDAAGTPTYATYLGGSGNDLPEAVAVNSAGDVYVTGATRSGDYPVDSPLRGMDSINGVQDAFVTRLSGGSIDFSTFLGGSSSDFGTSLANGPDGSLWVGGFTNSVDFPTRHAFRDTRSGPSDGFITKITGVRPRGPRR